MGKTLHDIVAADCPKQAVLVNPFFEDAPIFRSLPFERASHAFFNVAEEVVGITPADQTDIDGVLPIVNVETKLKQTDLKIIAGIHHVGEDKAAKLGGAGAYFSKRTPVIMAQTLQNVEKSLIYNNLRKFAIDNGKYFNATGDGATNYSIIAVRWRDGYNTALISPTLFSGNTFDITPVLGGQAYERDGKLVFGQRMKACFGIQLNSVEDIAAIVNIDLANNKIPTPQQLDQLVADARLIGADPNGGMRGALYLHPNLVTLLKQYDRSGFSANFSNAAGYPYTWGGVPIVPSYNFLAGTEAAVA